MSSPDPSAHKCISRGVRNFDNTVWDRVREDAVLAGNFAKFSQNPIMKYHPLSTAKNVLDEVSPFDPVWGIGLRADDPEARYPRDCEGRNARKSSFQGSRRHSHREAGFATQASSQQICNPTTTGRSHEISPAPPRPRALARACPGPPMEFSTCFSDALAASSPEVVAVTPRVVPSLALPDDGPSLVDGVITLDDASFGTKNAVYSGVHAVAPYSCVAFLETGSPQTFIRRDVLDLSLIHI